MDKSIKTVQTKKLEVKIRKINLIIKGRNSLRFNGNL